MVLVSTVDTPPARAQVKVEVSIPLSTDGKKETWESSVNNPAIMLVWRVRKSQSKPGWSGAEEIIYRKWSSKLFKSMRGDSNISKKNRLISVETARHCRALFLLPNRIPKVSESVWKDQYNRTMILVVIGFEQSFFTRAHSQCEHCSESSFRRRSKIISTNSSTTSIYVIIQVCSLATTKLWMSLMTDNSTDSP